MIIVKISGGLGNQLFQYSFGKYLSVTLNTNIKFDIQTKYKIKGFSQRLFGLNNLNLNIEIASNYDIKKFKCFFKNEFLIRLERKLVQIFPSINKSFIVQISNEYQKNIMRIRDNCYYDGYWQSEQYFKPIGSKIRDEFELKLKLNTLNTALLNKIINSESISIHIRRGDYISIKNNSKVFLICPVEYYIKAINFFINKLKNPKFYIFSDDHIWAKSNFLGEQFCFIEGNSKYPEIDMFLMSKCHHNIIANSTFSWWGAWFNSNPDKIVVAPGNWYKGRFNDSINDLILPDWILL